MMFFNKSWEEWVAQYSQSHQNRVNLICHTIGIPMIAVSILLCVASLIESSLWIIALSLFVIGWIFQFIGHAFEGKPPEFFKDWRFLFVGLRWWLAKIRGKV